MDPVLEMAAISEEIQELRALQVQPSPGFSGMRAIPKVRGCVIR